MSSTRQAATAAIEKAGIVAVIRIKDPAKLQAVVDAISEGGIRALEVTMTVPGAIELIAGLAPKMPPGFLLGAGTVLDAATALKVIDAGAQFIVSPVFRREVIDACHSRDVAVTPGCFTPTEILDAWDAGADIVKVFPATALGPGYIKDVRAPLPHVKLMPTGGVTLDNAGDWIAAGAVAVGVGSALTDAKAIEAGNFAVLRSNAERIVRSVRVALGEARPLSLTMPKVVTFGEIMLRLSPPGFERFLQTQQFVATFGGGEANVAVCLAAFGIDSYYVTRLPKHEIGEAAVRALRAEGVRTDYIVRGGDRIGIYYAEAGASQRASTVIYDRARSAISEMEADAVDWAAVFAGAQWYHVTGITPALGDKGVAATARSIKAARAAGVRISVDLNFRKKLWTEKKAQEIMGPLMRDVDVVIANEEDLQSVLGVHVPGTDVTSGQLNFAGFQEAAERVTRDFGPPMVAITLRESVSASDNGWSAALWDASTRSMHRSQRYDVRLVDRIGGGDSFAGGLIYGLVTGRTPQDSLRFAVAASALKQTIPGDFNRVTVAEVDRLAGGDASGRVQR